MLPDPRTLHAHRSGSLGQTSKPYTKNQKSARGFHWIKHIKDSNWKLANGNWQNLVIQTVQAYPQIIGNERADAAGFC